MNTTSPASHVKSTLNDIIAIVDDRSRESDRALRKGLTHLGLSFGIVASIADVDPLADPSCLFIDAPIDETIKARLPLFANAQWAIVFGPNASEDPQNYPFEFENLMSSVSSAIQIAERYETIPLRIRTAIGRREVEKIKSHIFKRDAATPKVEPGHLAPAVRVPDGHVRNDASGRLDAGRICELFSLKKSALAGLLSVSKQALSATPDAERIQENLAPYAEIAKLSSLVGEADFLKWLNTGSEDFGGQTPMQTILAGNATGVANFVNDIIELRGPHD